jgi:hypothetical protein
MNSGTQYFVISRTFAVPRDLVWRVNLEEYLEENAPRLSGQRMRSIQCM